MSCIGRSEISKVFSPAGIFKVATRVTLALPGNMVTASIVELVLSSAA